MIKQLPLLLLLLLLGTTACHRLKTEYWPNGNKKSEIARKGDSYDGPARFWFEDGTLQMECTYKNDKLEGHLTRYYSNGLKEEELFYKQGRLDSIYLAWDRSGNLVKQCGYRQDKPHGPYREWYPDKTLMVEGQYADGKIEGRWLYYTSSGHVIGEGVFSQGNGIQKTYYQDGRIKQVTTYKNSLKDGPDTFYGMDGSIEQIIHYSAGKIVNDEKK